MRTELIKEEKTRGGWGPNSGYNIYREYKCPCGKGKIVDDHDDIPGFREHDVYILCPECEKKYNLDFSKGKNNWQLVEKVN